MHVCIISQGESSFLYMGPAFIHEKVVLPEYFRARKVLNYDLVKDKLPKQMTDIISLDNEQFCKVFRKTSRSSPSPSFIKCNDVWVYAPSHCCFFSDVHINEMVEWGIVPEKGTAVYIQSCSKPEHGEHDFLAPFQFTNSELLAFYQSIVAGSDENRKRSIAQKYEELKTISHEAFGHENSCFHCSGHPIDHVNYKELDWTIRLFYSVKDNLGTNFSVRPSYNYASNYSFPSFQQQISSCPVSGVYPFKGAPDLLFTKRREAADVSLLMAHEIELFDLKQGYLTMPKVSVSGLPNVAGQIIAGLHFLTVAKIMRSIMVDNKVPENVRSRGLLVKRKDTMSLFSLSVNVKEASLAYTAATAQEMFMLEGFNSACLCTGIMKLFD